jgi:hypothetical protein
MKPKPSRVESRGTDEDEWRAALYADLLSNPQVLRAAQIELSRIAAGGTIIPHKSDIEAARCYLRACLTNMSIYELQSITVEAAGALWARGAWGATKYRINGGRRRDHKRRFKSPRPSSSSTADKDDEDDDDN